MYHNHGGKARMKGARKNPDQISGGEDNKSKKPGNDVSGPSLVSSVITSKLNSRIYIA